jgi:arginyl-tRNA--protein-N-Asp/Glu arginylyltransferase
MLTNMSYLTWDEKTITDFSDQNINDLYNQGYVFTRKDKGVMQQTRSLRIDLSKFKLSSENRRILKKNEPLLLRPDTIPYPDYTWAIGKMGKDFYTTKFGDGTFSANKIKELVTDENKSNFNRLLSYLHALELESEISQSAMLVGVCISRETNKLLHYSYPFYSLNIDPNTYSNLGLAMMTKAIVWAQDQNKKYIYLGSAQRPGDTYKLQFEGLEWFDGQAWKNDMDELKSILKKLDSTSK